MVGLIHITVKLGFDVVGVMHTLQEGLLGLAVLLAFVPANLKQRPAHFVCVVVHSGQLPKFFFLALGRRQFLALSHALVGGRLLLRVGVAGRVQVFGLHVQPAHDLRVVASGLAAKLDRPYPGAFAALHGAFGHAQAGGAVIMGGAAAHVFPRGVWAAFHAQKRQKLL